MRSFHDSFSYPGDAKVLLMKKYTLALDVFNAIAEGRCTYPEICAREMLELER